jgi:lipopolysaccharide export system protein LptA
MMRRARLGTVAAVALALAASASALAQGSRPAPAGPIQNAIQGQNGDQPVQIDADTLEVRDKSHIATFAGNVQVVQGETTMKCRTLVVLYGPDVGSGGDKPTASVRPVAGAMPAGQKIHRIEARGDVTIFTKDQHASGDLGVYDLPSKTITLTGNVVVTQGQNVIHGERLIVDTVTGNAHVEAVPGATQGRVRAVIVPSKGQSGQPTNFMTIGPGQSN